MKRNILFGIAVFMAAFGVYFILKAVSGLEADEITILEALKTGAFGVALTVPFIMVLR